jgi:PKD domain-containing protein
LPPVKVDRVEDYRTLASRYRLLGSVGTVLAILALSSFHVGPAISSPLPVPAQVPSSSGALIAVNPTAIADVSKTSGTIQIEVNVTNAPSINEFDVSLQYDRQVLSAPANGIDFSATILGTNTYVLFDCVDGVLIKGLATHCSPNDQPGVVSLAIAIQAGFTPAPTNGNLFNVTFNVIGRGVAQLHFLLALLANNGNQIPSDSFDGYFSNKNCNGPPCRPPSASFTVTPAVVRQGVPATFNASLSKSLNPGGTIRSYNWTWGVSGLQGRDTPNPVTYQTYPNAGNYTVILIVTDNYGISGSFSALVHITNKIIDTGIASLDVEPVLNILAGTDVDIKATAHNFGTQLWNITLSLFVEKKLVNQTFYPNVLRFHDAPTLLYIWHTTGKTAGSYRIDASVDPQPGDNDTDNDLTSTYVQIIEPRQSSLVNLGLLPATALGIILIVAGSASVSFIRRKLRPDLDAL